MLVPSLLLRRENLSHGLYDLAAVAVVTVLAFVSWLVTRASWPDVQAYSFNARLLTEVVPAPPAATSERYFGIQ